MRAWRLETNRVAGFWYMALRETAGRIINHVLGMITLLTSFVLFVSGREHKALHDWIAGTVVLHDPDKVLASRRSAVTLNICLSYPDIHVADRSGRSSVRLTRRIRVTRRIRYPLPYQILHEG